ncbi:hypothetical protein CYMTET_37206 [Cymbomonas tetramitiformis]|uniref:Uncharacterized protein n=1 Tax=Cymbomonas tetramitiformis TaxID=36881 RepID=A0AAE0F675_9CHLO|nr:hypothetical protein CYMTET_37206 [Cymbomonas tetramitiformis]
MGRGRNIVFDKNVNRDVELTRDEIDKLKGILFNSSLPAIFGSTEESTRRVSRFVLMPNSDRKTLPQLILEETEVYPPETGYMCEPITYPRSDSFQDEIAILQMLAGEDPHALRDRLVTLMERVNLPHESTQALYMLRALPEHIAGIVRERFGKTMDVTQEYTLNEVTEVAQDLFARLKSMETKIMKANLEQENLIQYVGAYVEGPTKSTLAKMLITGPASKRNFGLQAQPLIAPRTSTTRSDGPRPRLPAPRPASDNFNSAGLSPAGRKLLSQLTSPASAFSFNAEPAKDTSRVVVGVCSENVGGPNGDCIFCHPPLHQFHHPTLPCHISGNTTMYDLWVNQGKIPYALRHLMNLLIVNRDRVTKGQKPPTKAEFDQQYSRKDSNPSTSNHAGPASGVPTRHAGFYDYHSVPPHTHSAPTTRQADCHHVTTQPSDAAQDDAIVHFHLYASIVEHGSPFPRGAQHPTPDEPHSPRDGEVPHAPIREAPPAHVHREGPARTALPYSPDSPMPDDIPEHYPEYHIPRGLPCQPAS